MLEKQLDYMRKMVQTAEADRDTAIQRSAMVAKQAAQQTSEDVRGHLEKLSGLERDHMKLTAQHSIAEVSCRIICDIYAHNGISYSFSVQSSKKYLQANKNNASALGPSGK